MAGNPIGSTQGSILEPLLFNADIFNLFFVIEDCDIAKYADDKDPIFKREKC